MDGNDEVQILQIWESVKYLRDGQALLDETQGEAQKRAKLRLALAKNQHNLEVKVEDLEAALEVGETVELTELEPFQDCLMQAQQILARRELTSALESKPRDFDRLQAAFVNGHDSASAAIPTGTASRKRRRSGQWRTWRSGDGKQKPVFMRCVQCGKHLISSEFTSR